MAGTLNQYHMVVVCVCVDVHNIAHNVSLSNSCLAIHADHAANMHAIVVCIYACLLCTFLLGDIIQKSSFFSVSMLKGNMFVLLALSTDRSPNYIF